MAVIYLRSSDGNDADDGSTWALAKATLAAALTAAGAGGTVYVSDNHAESAAGVKNLVSPGTDASPVRVICVDDTSDPEPPTAKTTGAQVTTTGGNAITFSGYAYYYGIKFTAGSGGSAAALNFHIAAATAGETILESCELWNSTSSASQAIVIGVSGTNTPAAIRVEFINTATRWGATGQGINVRGARFIWRSSQAIVSGGTTPTNLIRPVAGSFTLVEIAAVDFSTVAVGNLFDNIDLNTLCYLSMRNCKLHASTALFAVAPVTTQAAEVVVVNCDSGDTNYKFSRTHPYALETQETTIVRTGGASDGTTPVSRKIVSTSLASVLRPYESPWMTLWNETLASITVTVPVVNDGVTFDDDEVWLEVEYLGTSGFPLAVLASDRITDPIFGTPAAQTTDSVSSWVTTGLASPVKQSLSVTVTPAEKGVIRARVVVGRASTTLYYDPKFGVQGSGRQYQSMELFVNEGLRVDPGISLGIL